ncbi:HlyD family secretion protein [Brucella tritici]|uniref:HlyD family secretion protein n=1 Tax=Brucella tritici TaxID=94626 RepID=A0A7X6FTB4_9HYPH|nr:HlyD family secretion protein [Brucella tritici]KAB2661636.1 HlyD family secretion protein [Brucella tritici]NKW10690.1 HlyD family secretion protein [Brucella tritici]
MRLAQIDLDRTRITAPMDGVVGVSGAREGQYVRAGSQLVSVVPVSKLYVVANFKETQLAKFRPGQLVNVTVDTFPGKELRGHVERLSPATGSEFSLLPPDNATGNFTKVAQRVGVRIALEQNGELDELLRPGMSVVATVHTDQSIETTASLIKWLIGPLAAKLRLRRQAAGAEKPCPPLRPFRVLPNRAPQAYPTCLL